MTARGERRKRGLSFVGISSIAAAGAGYLVFIVAARTLTPTENADFLAFWGVLFGIFGVLTGLMNEATRAVKSRRSAGMDNNLRGANVLVSSLAIGALAAIIIAATSPFWAGGFVQHSGPMIVAGLSVAAALYAGHVGLAGASAGLEAWGRYSVLASLEAAIRLIVIVAAAVAGAGLLGLEFGALSGAVVWLGVLLVSGKARGTLTTRADVGYREYLARAGYALLSAAASAVLITGFPAIIKLTAAPQEFAHAAPLLLAISLTRAPIMIPLQAFQGVVMTALIDSKQPLQKVLSKPFIGLLLLGLGGGVLAALVGPWIMLIFGPDYVVQGWSLGILTFDAALLALLTLTGTAALARSKHRTYLAGWAAATCTSVLLLFGPWSLTVDVLLSLTIGPLLGAMVHLWGARHHTLVNA